MEPERLSKLYALYLHGYAGVAQRGEYGGDDLRVLVLAAQDRAQAQEARSREQIGAWLKVKPMSAAERLEALSTL